MKQRRVFLSWMVLAAVICSGCAQPRQAGSPITPGFNLFSPEQDVEIGREAAAQVRQQVDIAQDQRLQAYTDRIGKALAATPDGKGFPYTFTLVNDPSINAFALPGGPVFINSGTLREASSEGEFAGVLAHEIAHVRLRHGTNQASRAQIAQLPAVLAGSVIGQGSLLAQLGQLGLQFGVGSVLLSYSREAEREADALGARIMSQAGYNPLAMAQFFEKLESAGGSRAPQFLSSHPSPGNRMVAVQREIQTLPQRQYGAGTGQFRQMQTLAAQLPAPRRRPQAAGVQPAGQAAALRELAGKTYSIAYPQGWEAFADGETNTVAMGPSHGLLRTSGGAAVIGHGAICSYYNPNPRPADVKEATEQLIQLIRSSNPNLALLGDPEQVEVDGYPGLIYALASESWFGGEEADYLLTVARPEGVFYMVFGGPKAAALELRPTFDRMVASIRFRQ